MGRLDLQKCIVGSVFTNCYFLKNKEIGEMLIIDPGDNAEKIEQKILEMQGKTLQESKINLTAYHMNSYTLKADVYLTDLQVARLAGFSVQMIETPGHTVGSCCYYLKDEGVLFSGDTVFCGSVGRTDFPEGSTAAIVESLHRLLDALPDDTEVYPGHDASTTIGYEKRYNPFV